MSKYLVQLIVDTEASEIESSAPAVEEFVKASIHEAACIDHDQIYVMNASRLED